MFENCKAFKKFDLSEYIKKVYFSQHPYFRSFLSSRFILRTLLFLNMHGILLSYDVF